MPTLNEMYPSKWLKAEDCEEADLILTISEVKMESVGQGAQSETKPVVYFQEVDKGLVLNKTNAKTIAKLHNDDTDQWEGKRIALYAAEVEFQGETMLGIRVRLKEPKKVTRNGRKTAPEAGTETTAVNAVSPASPDGEEDEDCPF